MLEKSIRFRDEWRRRPTTKELTVLWGILEGQPNKHLLDWFRMKDIEVGLGQERVTGVQSIW